MENVQFNYRGFTVTLDTDSGEFNTSIVDLGKSSKSLASIKQFIDDYIKENQAFAPFNVVGIEAYRGERARKKIIGIRKDGRFICEEPSGKKGQISEYEEKGLMLDLPQNDPVFATIAVLELEIDNIRNKIKDQANRLTIKTLRDIKPQYRDK